MHPIPRPTFRFSLVVFLFSGLTLAAADQNAPLDQQYSKQIRPLLQQYCFDCHSAEKQKGDVNLERLTSFEEARTETKVWEKAFEMLHTGEMPPAKKPQPSPADRTRLEEWVRSLLETEARAHAGDPGRVILRRLSNVEYTFTVRDLTGVELDPAREFPVDGAAGEGFVNVGEALVMSPSLLDKYFAAAQDIANHAVLLPDGFRFSLSVRRGDWVDDRLKQIRAFYARYTEAKGGQRINLQGIVFDTNTGGRLPIEHYLAATLEEGDALKSGTKTLEAVARERSLNAKYLAGLWNLLTQRTPSPLLDVIRVHWREAKPSDVAALTAEIAQWQGALTRFQTVGHVKPWMVPLNPLTARQEIHFKIAASGSTNVTLYLVAGDAGDGNDQDFVIWEKPRIVRPGRPSLLLRDFRQFTDDMIARRERLLGSTARCLAAAAEASTSTNQIDTTELAGRHQVEPELLSAWLGYLGIGTSGVLKIDGYFTNQIPSASNYDFIKGWGSHDTPLLLANSTDQHVRVPGNMKPHAVAVHPSPTLNAVVGWRSPRSGPLHVEATVTHAHPECGNGVTWSIELRRGATRQRLANGIAQGAKEAKAAENISVREGDLVSLVIGPRDGNHACDLTDLEFVLKSTEDTNAEWSLTRDVSGDILAGNPHADHVGHDAVWHFYTEPVTAGAETGPIVPGGSLLARWQTAGFPEEKRELAQAVQTLLSGPPPSPAESPDALLYRQLTSLGGPLLAGAQELMGSKLERSAIRPGGPEGIQGEAKGSKSSWGLDPMMFGRHPNGSAIEAESLCVRAPATLELQLPADLVAGAELVTVGVLHAETGSEGSVQLQVLTNKPAMGASLLPNTATIQRGNGPWGSDGSQVVHSAPILVRDGSAARQRIEAGFDAFRGWFPAALCYTKIVPVDEVITLTVFHREDEPLSRLMLNEAEKAELDRLWDELHFIGQDKLTMVDAYAQLLEYASQDSDPKLFAHLRQPINDRATAFKQLLKDSEPRQVKMLVEFAQRAYRRPLTETEQEALPRLYQDLREQKIPHEEAFRLTMARLFLSPSFLYRAETPPAGGEAQPVSDWELASRLSYFLWSSMPDDALGQQAAAGRLHDPNTLVSEARRMMQDKRLRALATEFACQWLHIREFDSFDEKSEQYFPTFAALRGAMYEESVLFFLDLFQRDGSVLEVLNADHTFLNETLAAHYGIPGVSGPEWRRVDGVQRYGRGGILGMATVLSKQSGASRTSPILRGNWLVETLLGDGLPKPPPNVPRLPETETDTGDLTVREITARHSTVPECAKCHVRIDPFGFALEQYDAIGRWREKDLAGRPIDARAHLQWKDDATFEGLPGLRAYLLDKRRDEYTRTFCRKLLGYALARGLQLSDMPLVEEMQSRLRSNNYKFSAALETVLRSQQFRYHRGLDATKEEEL